MKSLQEIWSNVGQETEELKSNYYITLLTFGVHGKIRLIVSENDINKEFGDDLRRLFMPDNKTVKIRVTVKIAYKNEDFKDNRVSSKYILFIDNVDSNGDVFSAELRRADGKLTGKDIDSDEEYEKVYVKKFNSGDIKSWNDILNLFDI